MSENEPEKTRAPKSGHEIEDHKIRNGSALNLLLTIVVLVSFLVWWWFVLM